MLKDCNHTPLKHTDICSTCSKPDDWQQHAKCLNHNPDKWYCPEDDMKTITEAISICMTCPVRGFCLEEGWSNRWGIWGSFTANEREKIRRNFPLSKHSIKRRREIIRTIAHRL